MDKVRYELIILARESVGFTQAELSEALRVEQGTISKIENGLLEASEDIVDKIAIVLDFPKSFFYQDWNPIRVEGLYRRKISLPAKIVKECKAKMTLAERHLSILLSSLELPITNLPKWDVEVDGSPSMCARYVREFWKIPKGRIENLSKILEDNGVVIIELDLEDLDGFSTFSHDNIPIIFVNKTRPGDRDLFNKAHEISHFIMHFGQKISEARDIDREANEFASEFLIPQKDIESHLVKLNLAKLADLKMYWRVSMQAIIMKARKCGFLTDNQNDYLWKQMGAMGYRKKEPIEIPREKPTLFQEMLSTYQSELSYSKQDLSKLLHFKEEHIDEWYFDKRSKLRVVRKSA